MSSRSVTLSATEAEDAGTAETVGEGTVERRLRPFYDRGLCRGVWCVKFYKIVIYEGKQGAKALADYPFGYSRTKHMHV